MSEVSCRARSASAPHISQVSPKQSTALLNRGIEKLQPHPRSPGDPPASPPPSSARQGAAHKSKSAETLLKYLEKKQ